MFALADYIGEDRVNAALRSFLEKNRYASGPFPDTRGFVTALREVTPPELQYVITDMFESIVLFDNKAVSATYVPAPDHKYKVTLAVSAQKRKADGAGNESPMSLDDRIDVGVFSGTKDHLKQLELSKYHLTERESTLTFVVNQVPTWAGIDPYHKLIDRTRGQPHSYRKEMNRQVLPWPRYRALTGQSLPIFRVGRACGLPRRSW